MVQYVVGHGTLVLIKYSCLVGAHLMSGIDLELMPLISITIPSRILLHRGLCLLHCGVPHHHQHKYKSTESKLPPIGHRQWDPQPCYAYNNSNVHAQTPLNTSNICIYII